MLSPHSLLSQQRSRLSPDETTQPANQPTSLSVSGCLEAKVGKGQGSREFAEDEDEGPGRGPKALTTKKGGMTSATKGTGEGFANCRR